jgi:hypothetical protein
LQSVGWRAGTALIIGQAVKKKPLKPVDSDKIFIKDIGKNTPNSPASDPKTWYSSS